MKNVRWPLVFWLFVLSAVAYLDRVNLAVAGTRLEADYHLSDIQLGWIFSAFLLGYAAFQTPAGWLADRWGPRRVCRRHQRRQPARRKFLVGSAGVRQTGGRIRGKILQGKQRRENQYG